MDFIRDIVAPGSDRARRSGPIRGGGYSPPRARRQGAALDGDRLARRRRARGGADGARRLVGPAPRDDELVTLDLARGGPCGDRRRRSSSTAAARRCTSSSSGVTLTWPDGLAGLRLPSVVFFLLALPAAGLVAGRLVDGRAATLLPLTLACAPLAVGLATFGRMYSLLLAATLWSTVVALWAARRDSLLGWTLAGIAAGLLVYAHPVAPLYSALVVVTGLLCAAVPFRRLLKVAWPAPLALALVQAPYYAVALGVLRDRYEVELGAPRAQAIRAAGRSVPEQGLDRPRPRGARRIAPRPRPRARRSRLARLGPAAHGDRPRALGARPGRVLHLRAGRERRSSSRATSCPRCRSSSSSPSPAAWRWPSFGRVGRRRGRAPLRRACSPGSSSTT